MALAWPEGHVCHGAGGGGYHAGLGLRRRQDRLDRTTDGGDMCQARLRVHPLVRRGEVQEGIEGRCEQRDSERDDDPDGDDLARSLAQVAPEGPR